MAWEGHTLPHSRQLVHSFQSMVRTLLSKEIAPGVQASAHFLQPMHLRSLIIISGSLLKPSGLLHHGHVKGQPFINRVVLIPGPSCIENFWILNINPLCLSELSGIICTSDDPASLAWLRKLFPYSGIHEEILVEIAWDRHPTLSRVSNILGVQTIKRPVLFFQ